MRLRVLIVEDEDLARQRLRILLAAHDDTAEIVGEATTGPDAVEQIQRLRPDVVFLDIELPGSSGFEVLSQLEFMPLVVFITGHDEYALQAFEENSIDYLLKPVEPDRLDRSMAKLQRLARDPLGMHEHLQRVLTSSLLPRPRHFCIETGTNLLVLCLDDVVSFEAEDKYVYARTSERRHITEYSLAQLEERLDPSTFVRIHRSAIVNVNHILEIMKWFNGKHKVRLKDRNATELVVSRKRMQHLLGALTGR